MYHVTTYLNPKGRAPQPYHTVEEGNKRNAIRRARKLLRTEWARRDANVKTVRVSVRDDDAQLLYQARIDEDTAQNGYRRMIKNEEL